MSLSVRSQSQENKVQLDLSEKKSFFKPFQENEDCSDNLISFDNAERKFVPDSTIGSSIKLDGSSVVRFSIRVEDQSRTCERKEQLLINTGTQDSDNRTNRAVGISIVKNDLFINKLENLLEDDIFHCFESSKSNFVDMFDGIVDNSVLINEFESDDPLIAATATTEDEEAVEDVIVRDNRYNLENRLADLCDLVLVLDKVLDFLERVTNFPPHEDVLKKCMDLITRLVKVAPENELAVLLRQARKEINKSEAQIAEAKGNCLTSVIALQTLTNVPKQLLKSLYFEVEGQDLSVTESKELKTSYSFLLVYHMMSLLLRKLFELCLLMDCTSHKVLEALEGFIWIAIEMDKSDIIIRMEDQFWRWNNQNKWIDETEVQAWCINLVIKMEENFNKEVTSCQDEDEQLNIKDKYNLAKLFINEFNDMLFSLRKANDGTEATREYTDLLTRFANSLETRLSRRGIRRHWEEDGMDEEVGMGSIMESHSPLISERNFALGSLVLGSSSVTMIVDANIELQLPQEPSYEASRSIIIDAREVNETKSDIEKGQLREAPGAGPGPDPEPATIEEQEQEQTQRIDGGTEFDTMVLHDGSIYFHTRPVRWLHFMTTVPHDGYRYKIWMKLRKIKEHCIIHWSRPAGSGQGFAHGIQDQDQDERQDQDQNQNQNSHQALSVRSKNKAKTKVSSHIRNGLIFQDEYLNTTYGDLDPPTPGRFSRLREKKKRLMFKFFGDDD